MNNASLLDMLIALTSDGSLTWSKDPDMTGVTYIASIGPTMLFTLRTSAVSFVKPTLVADIGNERREITDSKMTTLLSYVNPSGKIWSSCSTIAPKVQHGYGAVTYTPASLNKPAQVGTINTSTGGYPVFYDKLKFTCTYRHYVLHANSLRELLTKINMAKSLWT